MLSPADRNKLAQWIQSNGSADSVNNLQALLIQAGLNPARYNLGPNDNVQVRAINIVSQLETRDPSGGLLKQIIAVLQDNLSDVAAAKQDLTEIIAHLNTPPPPATDPDPPPPIIQAGKLSGPDKSRLVTMLASAFTSYSAIAALTDFYLNTNLQQITSPTDLLSVIRNVVNWCEEQGGDTLKNFVCGALGERPNRNDLKTLAQELKISCG